MLRVRQCLIWVFQSTPPARGATSAFDFDWGLRDISIHAPREGGDSRGELTTLRTGISIHAPREGGDVCSSKGALHRSDFNPRPPRGGRLGFSCPKKE